MFKTKFFSDESPLSLQDKVNKFILDKEVVSISYTVAPCGYGYKHCCCVLYDE